MAYFKTHHGSLKLPSLELDGNGFRRAQLGALHAVLSHFTLRTNPAIVTMPTGTGKTAVLMALPFLLRAQRVLVIAPSRLLSRQIVDDFQSLKVLKRIGAIAENYAVFPKCILQKEKVTDWNELQGAEVVVGTPNSLSPALEGIPQPPNGFFDLVLVDEAHHYPASTWTALGDSFPEAQKVLFTATPFRRDTRIIPGRFVYTYPINKAYEDGLFATIDFHPVAPGTTAFESDVKLAVEAETIYNRDKGQGLDHNLLVRTDSRVRADELLAVYEGHTSLKLRVIHGDHTPKRVADALKQMKAGELDGLICVNMLGEGIDLPQLKVCALHSPYKSLAATLQFIGRFARTTGTNTGNATFLAHPQEIESEAGELFDQGAAWSKIIPQLAGTRISQEERLREVVDSFDEVVSLSPYDFSLFAIRPYFHVKVYSKITGDLDVSAFKALPRPLSVYHLHHSVEHNCVVMVGRATEIPLWAESDIVTNRRFELVVLYYNPTRRLLFVGSTIKSKAFYDFVTDQLNGPLGELSLSKVMRVMRDIDLPRFFGVGLNALNYGSESYRTSAGSQSDRAITVQDTMNYGLGHVFFTGVENDEEMTLGLSKNSKIWSQASGSVPDFIAWCDSQAEKLETDGAIVTNTAIDRLATGQPIVEPLPDLVYLADWNVITYRTPLRFNAEDSDSLIARCKLTVTGSSPRVVDLNIETADGTISLHWTPFEAQQFRYADLQAPVLLFSHRSGQEVDLIEYLCVQPLTFFSARGEVISAGLIYQRPLRFSLNDDQFRSLDWAALNVDIRKETETDRTGFVPIHDYVGREYVRTHDVVVNDDSSYEAADLVAIRELPDCIEVDLVHCKFSGGDDPSARVKDFYEVCGQAQRSTRWSLQLRELIGHLKGRLNRNNATLLKGDVAALEGFAAKRLPWRCRTVIVQPGLSLVEARQTDSEIQLMLIATNDFVQQSFQNEPILVWCSP